MRFHDFDSAQLPRGHKEFTWLEVAPRPDGGMWRLPLLYVTGEQDGPTLSVVAGVHGDEYEGVEAIPQVFGQVEPDELRGTLLIVPVCNMPAYEAGTRSSPVDGLNLARVLPGKVNGSITRQIGYWIVEKVMMAADLFIDLHSGGVAYNIPTSVYYCRIETEQGRRTFEAAQAFGAPVIIGLDASIGSSGTSFRTGWDRGIPSIFTEGPGGGRTRPDDVQCYAQGVLNVLMYLDMIPGTPQPQPATHHLVSDGKPAGVYAASVAGYFRPEVALLDQVSQGQQLGVIQDFSGGMLEEFIAQRDGFISTLRAIPRVNVGDDVIKITGGEALTKTVGN